MTVIISIYLQYHLSNRREDNDLIIKNRLEELESYKDCPIRIRMDLLNDVFGCVSQYCNTDLIDDEMPDNVDYVIQYNITIGVSYRLSEYILKRIFPEKEDLINEMVPSVLNHDDNHPSQSTTLLHETEQREFVFTVYYVISVFNYLEIDCS